jgi:hypothetical protein
MLEEKLNWRLVASLFSLAASKRIHVILTLKAAEARTHSRL